MAEPSWNQTGAWFPLARESTRCTYSWAMVSFQGYPRRMCIGASTSMRSHLQMATVFVVSTHSGGSPEADTKP